MDMKFYKKNYSDLGARQRKRRRAHIVKQMSQKKVRSGEVTSSSEVTIENNSHSDSISDEEILDNAISESDNFENESNDNSRKERKIENSTENPVPIKTHEETIEMVIREWALAEKKTVSNSSVTRLLQRFHKYYPGLAKTSKTLRGERICSTEIIPMGRGHYAHYINWLECL